MEAKRTLATKMESRRLFNEVKIELLKVDFIYAFLDSVMFFFILYFIVSFFNIKFVYTLVIPAIVTLIFFIIAFAVRVNKSRLKDMEDANPQLKEMLRTAHDNQHEDNILAHALFEELKGKLRTASSGNLIQSKKIMTRIISAIVIVFLIVFFSTISINIDKIDIPLGKFNFVKQTETHREGNLTDIVYNQTDIIYGDADIAKLGNDKIDINVNPTTNDVDFDKIQDAENSKLREGSLPQEIGVNPDAFNNQKVLDDAEAAANYSQRISKI